MGDGIYIERWVRDGIYRAMGEKSDIYRAMGERDLSMDQSNNGRQWNMEFTWRRQTFQIYIYIYNGSQIVYVV